MTIQIIARWYKKIVGLDAVKVIKDGEEFWSWCNNGQNVIIHDYYTLNELLTDHPSDNLTQIAAGKGGPPDWVFGGAEVEKKAVKNRCVCSTVSLWATGCSIDKTGVCKSQVGK